MGDGVSGASKKTTGLIFLSLLQPGPFSKLSLKNRRLHNRKKNTTGRYRKFQALLQQRCLQDVVNRVRVQRHGDVSTAAQNEFVCGDVAQHVSISTGGTLQVEK